MYQDHQSLPRRFYKEQCKEGEEGGDKGKRWEKKIAKQTKLKFCDAVREAENKIKWRERVTTGQVQVQLEIA